MRWEACLKHRLIINLHDSSQQQYLIFPAANCPSYVLALASQTPLYGSASSSLNQQPLSDFCMADYKLPAFYPSTDSITPLQLLSVT